MAEGHIHEHTHRAPHAHHSNDRRSSVVLGPGETQIDNSALDGIISHNSLFTGAVFAGISVGLSSSSGGGLISSGCTVGSQVGNDLVSYQVFAFALFLFSSLVALALKQGMRQVHPHRPRTARIDRAMLRAGMVASALGSMTGCGFLMLGLINVVQSRLGRVGCGASAAASSGAVVSLVTLIPTAMVIYSIIVFRAFTNSM